MGLFDNMFGKKTKETNASLPMPEWIALESEDQLDSIMLQSIKRPQIVFKHSTSCGISRMALNLFKGTYDVRPEEADLYYLDIHLFRGISNELSERLKVRHESPQLLVIKDKTVVAQDSHGSIPEMDIRKYL